MTAAVKATARGLMGRVQFAHRAEMTELQSEIVRVQCPSHGAFRGEEYRADLIGEDDCGDNRRAQAAPHRKAHS